MDAKNAPTAPPIIPQTKGFMNRKLIPKMAGSVMPREAEREAGKATARVFFL